MASEPHRWLWCFLLILIRKENFERIFVQDWCLVLASLLWWAFLLLSLFWRGVFLLVTLIIDIDHLPLMFAVTAVSFSCSDSFLWALIVFLSWQCLVSEGLVSKMMRFIFCNLCHIKWCDVSEHLWGYTLLVVMRYVFAGSLSGVCCTHGGYGGRRQAFSSWDVCWWEAGGFPGEAGA